MRARRLAAMCLLGVTLSASGCAVGRFIAGAPATASATRAAADAPAPLAGRALLTRRCSGCHQTPDPTRMTAAAWQGALERMKRRMQLPAAEWDSLAAL